VNSVELQQRKMLVRSLRGAPWTVLMAMLLLPGPHGVSTLCEATGFSDKTVSRALGDLESLGFVQQHGRYVAYILTAQARQLMLWDTEKIRLPIEAEGEPVEDAPDSETENLRLEEEEAAPETVADPGRRKKSVSPSSSSCSPTTGVGSHASKTTTTTTPNDSPDPQALDPPAEKALGYLLEVAVPRQRALHAIQAALRRGWDGEQVLDCVAGWLDYAESPEGASIRQPGFLALKRLQTLQPAPAPAEQAQPTTADYIAAAYERVVRH